jgi:hypothetical protein
LFIHAHSSQILASKFAELPEVELIEEEEEGMEPMSGVKPLTY